EQAEEQAAIDNAEPLTKEEEEEKESLANSGFSNWNRRDFQQFVNGCAKFGRKAYSAIAEEMDSKTAEEVQEYAEVFWERLEELDSHDKILNTIEAGEEKNRKVKHQQKLLRRKIE